MLRQPLLSPPSAAAAVATAAAAAAAASSGQVSTQQKPGNQAGCRCGRNRVHDICSDLCRFLQQRLLESFNERVYEGGQQRIHDCEQLPWQLAGHCRQAVREGGGGPGGRELKQGSVGRCKHTQKAEPRCKSKSGAQMQQPTVLPEVAGRLHPPAGTHPAAPAGAPVGGREEATSSPYVTSAALLDVKASSNVSPTLQRRQAQHGKAQQAVAALKLLMRTDQQQASAGLLLDTGCDCSASVRPCRLYKR